MPTFHPKPDEAADKEAALALKRDEVFFEFEEDIYMAKDEDIIDVYEGYCERHKDIDFKAHVATENILKFEMQRRIYLAKIAYYKRKE